MNREIAFCHVSAIVRANRKHLSGPGGRRTEVIVRIWSRFRVKAGLRLPLRKLAPLIIDSLRIGAEAAVTGIFNREDRVSNLASRVRRAI